MKTILDQRFVHSLCRWPRNRRELDPKPKPKSFQKKTNNWARQKFVDQEHQLEERDTKKEKKNKAKSDPCTFRVSLFFCCNQICMNQWGTKNPPKKPKQHTPKQRNWGSTGSTRRRRVTAPAGRRKPIRRRDEMVQKPPTPLGSLKITSKTLESVSFLFFLFSAFFSFRLGGGVSCNMRDADARHISGFFFVCWWNVVLPLKIKTLFDISATVFRADFVLLSPILSVNSA